MRLNKEILELGADAILPFVQRRWAECEEAHLVTALHRAPAVPGLGGRAGLARLGHVPRELDVLVAALEVPRMTPRHLANSAWALARLAHRAPVLPALLAAARQRLEEFKPQELASSLWAQAAVRLADEAFSRSLAGRAAELIGGLDPRGLSGTAWALAQLALRDSFFDALAAAGREAELGAGRVEACLLAPGPQEVSNIAWAMAKLRCGGYIEVLAGRARELGAELLSQHLSNTLWSLARLLCRDLPLVAAIGH